jgi:hypothetical protein
MSRRHVVWLAAFFSTLVTVALAAPEAHAYPQWQLSTGAARCNQCHYAPAGSGLINAYGRDANGDELSTFQGNGAFLHGLVSLPDFLAIGADLRGALVTQDVQDPIHGSQVHVFPMQADLEAHAALPLGFSLYGTLGARGRTRTSGDWVPTQNYQPISTSLLISREHWAMWQPEAQGPYVRVGRFFAPFGLRLAEHITYIRRDLGFNQLEESYNLSAGYIFSAWELHLTLFAPDFIRHIGSDEKGVTTYYEHRLLDDTIALGGQMRFAASDGLTRFILGAVAKAWVAPVKTLFFGEVDSVQLMFDSPIVGTREQIVAALGATVMPIRGIMFTALGERNQLDLEVRDSAWTAGSLLLNWFPYPHCEVQVMGRFELPGGGDVAKTFLAQIHYWL